MYQFHIGSGSPQQVSEAFRKAVGRGITWFEIEGDIDSDTLAEIEQECRERGLILTVDNSLDLLVEKRYHGILFTAEAQPQIEQLREVHGAHPIVGVRLLPGQDYMHFRPLDIDYFTINVDEYSDEELKNYVDDIHSNWDIPVVACTGNMSAGKNERLINAGFNGFCLLNVNDLEFLPKS